VYGTKGKCRKGTETEAKIPGKGRPEKAAKKKSEMSSSGSKVYDIGKGKVLKVGKYSEEAARAHSIAANMGLAPRLHSSGISKKGVGFQVMEKKDVADIEALPRPGQSNKAPAELSINQLRKEQEALRKLSSDQVWREKEAYKASLQLNSKGVSHGDLHGGNIKWDKTQNKPVILNFDNARVNAKAARDEAASTLNSIAIRLEKNSLYDGADMFYSLSSKVRRSGPKTFEKLIYKAKELIDEEFPYR